MTISGTTTHFSTKKQRILKTKLLSKQSNKNIMTILLMKKNQILLVSCMNLKTIKFRKKQASIMINWFSKGEWFLKIR